MSHSPQEQTVPYPWPPPTVYPHKLVSNWQVPGNLTHWQERQHILKINGLNHGL